MLRFRKWNWLALDRLPPLNFRVLFPKGSLFFVLFLTPFALIGQDDRGEGVLQRILAQYTETYGGLRDATVLNSVSIEGRLVQDGKEHRFIMQRKRPNLLRYRLFSDAHSVTAGYDGEMGWLRTQTGESVSIERLSGVALVRLRAQAHFESPLFQHQRKNEYTFKLRASRYLGDRSAEVIEVIDPDGLVSHYFLDSRTTYLLRIDRFDATASLVGQTLYSDYRLMEGYPFAHQVEERAGEKTLSVATVESISVNSGLLSFLFKEPVR